MRQRSAGQFLYRAGLHHAQQVVGFDIIQRKEDQKKSPPIIEYGRKTDRDLYEGLDSSIKAAIFWYREDRRRQRLQIGSSDSCYIALNIPLLVFSLPFWDVPIDAGTAGEPELRSSGYHVGLYPSGDSERQSEPIMSILWEATKLGELTNCFKELINWFVDETMLAVEKA